MLALYKKSLFAAFLAVFYLALGHQRSARSPAEARHRLRVP